MTILQFNALKKFKFNQTSEFVKQEFLPENYKFIHKIAYDMDAAHLEKTHKAKLIAFKDTQIVKQKAEKRHRERCYLLSWIE